MTPLYVRVLNGSGRRKIHSPDCTWVAGSVKEPPPAPPKRQYELVLAGRVTGPVCRWCGGVPGRAPVGETVVP